jgi:hypothetical protein
MNQKAKGKRSLLRFESIAKSFQHLIQECARYTYLPSTLITSLQSAFEEMLEKL